MVTCIFCENEIVGACQWENAVIGLALLTKRRILIMAGNVTIRSAYFRMHIPEMRGTYNIPIEYYIDLVSSVRHAGSLLTDWLYTRLQNSMYNLLAVVQVVLTGTTDCLSAL